MTTPRFLVDECCPATLVGALRDLGFDVRYVAEEVPGLSDDDVLRSATAEDRILVTTDKDFGALTVRLGHMAVGLILLRLSRLGTYLVAKKAAAMIQENAENLAGHITTFTEDRVRRRSLP